MPSAAARAAATTETAKAADAPAKSRDPARERITVYVRRVTRKAAWRRWEDEEGGDLSDLVQHLLERYLAERARIR